MTFPGFPERIRGRVGVKAAHGRAALRSRALTPTPEPRQIIPTSGECLLQTKAPYWEPEAIRSTTDSLCAGDRWLYRADIVIVLWPAAS